MGGRIFKKFPKIPPPCLYATVQNQPTRRSGFRGKNFKLQVVFFETTPRGVVRTPKCRTTGSVLRPLVHIVFVCEYSLRQCVLGSVGLKYSIPRTFGRYDSHRSHSSQCWLRSYRSQFAYIAHRPAGSRHATAALCEMYQGRMPAILIPGRTLRTSLPPI